MPILPNARHEAYCQHRFKGKSIDDAYKLAGFKPNRGNAARLNANEGVQKRLAELQSAVAAKATVTVEDIIRQLDEDRQFARECGSAAAAVSATVNKAKILGIGAQPLAPTKPDADEPEVEDQPAGSNVVHFDAALKRFG